MALCGDSCLVDRALPKNVARGITAHHFGLLAVDSSQANWNCVMFSVVLSCAAKSLLVFPVRQETDFVPYSSRTSLSISIVPA